MSKIGRQLKKLDEMERKLHTSSTDSIVDRFSSELKRYYNHISTERQELLIKYIIDLEIQKSGKIRGLKTRRGKSKTIYKAKNGDLKVVINHEAYDHTMLSKKKYRKMLAKDASSKLNKKEKKKLKSTKNELSDNDSIDKKMVDEFYAKYGL